MPHRRRAGAFRLGTTRNALYKTLHDARGRLRTALIDAGHLDARPYLSCDDCFARMDEYVEQLARNPDHDDPPMRAHLRGCGACAEEADALTELLRQP